jgi:hypothetical protein
MKQSETGAGKCERLQTMINSNHELFKGSAVSRQNHADNLVHAVAQTRINLLTLDLDSRTTSGGI